MPVLVVAAVVLATWIILARLGRSPKRPKPAKPPRNPLGLLRKLLAALAGVVLLALMGRGCNGDEATSVPGRGTGGEQPPCTAYHVADCLPSTSTSSSTTIPPGMQRAPCPAYHAEDCPLIPVSP